MKYRHLFFDLDHTLWDFEENARSTLRELHEQLDLASRGVNNFDTFHRNYLAHNEKLWEKYRKGQVRQEDLRVKRMALSLLDFKIADDALASSLSEQFLELLPTRNILFPNTIETLDYLSNKGYHLHLITNGFEKTQHSKLKYSGLAPYFIEVITSEGSNSLKPEAGIFQCALDRTKANLSESIMIGDALEVDIVGACNVGMDQVHVNYISKERLPLEDGRYPTHTIYSISELTRIL